MRKRIGCLLLVSLLLICAAPGTCAAAPLSPAVALLQEECAVLKTGVGLNTVSFSEEDFLPVFGESETIGIVVTTLPALSDGILKLGALDVREGQIIAGDALAALRFIPRREGATATFGFLPYGRSYEKDFVCTVYMLDSLNFAPTADASSLFALQRVPVYASLTAKDPDGDQLTYRLTQAPKKGSLLWYEDGSYRYTANADAEGEDSFSYVAVDPYGNRSQEAVVTIYTGENTRGILYADMTHAMQAHPAVLLAEKGAFVGEQIGEEWYFHPERTVTRGEFLVMAMKMNDIDVSLLAADDSGFADSDGFSDAENKYIATAARLGLVVGIDTENGRCFYPERVITSAQASTIIGRIARLQGLAFADAVLAFAQGEEEISDEGMAALCEAGFSVSSDRNEPVTRADAAALLYQLSLTCGKG